MEEIDLKELFKEFWNKKIFLCVATILSIILAGVLCLVGKNEPSTFTANATILITKYQIEDEEKDILQDVNSIVALITSDVMLDEIKNKIGLEIKKENIIVANDVSNIVNFGVTYGNKKEAIEISNVIINKLTEKSFAIFKENEIDIEVINYPEKSCDENITESNLYLALALLPIVFSFGVVFVMYVFDTRIKSKDIVEKELGVKVIEELKVFKKENNSIENELTTIFDFKSENSKLFKIIVAKILNKININEQNVLMITSPNSSEGKTYIASNISTVLAMFGKKVIVLDTDFENSKLDKIFKVPNTLGLSNYLTGVNANGQEIKETLNNFIQETDIKNLNIITAGNVKENITNCIVSERFDEFIKQLKFYYDFIIIDSENILNTPNSLILSSKANNTIVVVDRNSTKIEELDKIKNDIKEVNGNLLGVIINETVKQNIIKEKLEKIKNKKNKKEKTQGKNNKILDKICEK